MISIKKMALASALTLSIVTACTASPMAMGLHTGREYEKAAEAYAQSIEDLVEETGDAYEEITESYPDTAVNNPAAPSQYLGSAVKLGSNFLSKMFSFTNSYFSLIK